jgi:hypothetical protein
VFLPIFCHLAHQPGQYLGSPIANGLPSDFHNVDIRKEAHLRSEIKAFQKRSAHQAFSHKATFYVKSFSIFFTHECHGTFLLYFRRTFEIEKQGGPWPPRFLWFLEPESLEAQ